MNISRLQVRTLPDRRGYGLCDPGDRATARYSKEGARWVGRNNAEVISDGAAMAFPSVISAHMYRYDLAGKDYAAEKAKGQSKAAKADRGKK